MARQSNMEELQELIQHYNNAIREMHGMAGKPGQIRSSKGALVEFLAQRLVELAWRRAGGSLERLSFNDTRRYPMPIRAEYIARQPADVANFINSLTPRQFYQAQVDLHVFVDNDFVLGVECKSYAENAMLKRVLIDFWLLKSLHPNLICCLLQLESQLTGDYSSLDTSTPVGSAPTHTLLSYFPQIDLNLFTLLDGERKVNEAIHEPAYFKELRRESLDEAVSRFSQLLRPLI